MFGLPNYRVQATDPRSSLAQANHCPCFDCVGIGLLTLKYVTLVFTNCFLSYYSLWRSKTYNNYILLKIQTPVALILQTIQIQTLQRHIISLHTPLSLFLQQLVITIQTL